MPVTERPPMLITWNYLYVYSIRSKLFDSFIFTGRKAAIIIDCNISI